MFPEKFFTGIILVPQRSSLNVKSGDDFAAVTSVVEFSEGNSSAVRPMIGNSKDTETTIKLNGWI